MSYYNASPTTLQHPHEGFGSKRQPKVSTHMGKDVFISMNASESSLSPLPIPEDLKAKEGAISTITCVHTVTIVINGQVYLYFKSLDRWSPSAGVTSPAFEHSYTHCCYLGADSQCKELSWTLFAYSTRCSVSNSSIFVSKAGSYTFTSIKSKIRKQRALFGVYNFISLAMTGLLISRTGGDEAGKVAAGTDFRYNATMNRHMSSHTSPIFHLLPTGTNELWNIQNLVPRSLIILWTTNVLSISFHDPARSWKKWLSCLQRGFKVLLFLTMVSSL